MMSSIVIAIFLLSIGASFVQRTTGFGFGIFIMTMLPFFLPTYGEATTLSGLLAITTSAVIVWRMREYVTWSRLWPILLTFIIVSTVAIFALTPFVAQVGRIGSKDNYQQRKALIAECAAVVRHIASDYNATLLDFEKLFNGLTEHNASYWIWDGIHPTAAGHQKMADLWLSTIK